MATNNNNIQEQTVEIVEDFFLRKNDKDLYTFLRAAIEKPLLEKFLGKTVANPTEAEDMLRSLHSEV